jgi:hypothetical protein
VTPPVRPYDIALNRPGLRKLLAPSQSQIEDVEKQFSAPASITREYHLKPCQHGKKLIIRQNDKHETAQPDPSLIKAIARAHAWFEDLKKGLSYKDIASRDEIDQRHVARTVRLAFLAPDITRAILSGREPSGLTSQALVRITHLPADWNEQLNLLGFN